MKAQEQIKKDGSNFQADTLTDLPVTEEQANQTKAGTEPIWGTDGAICIALSR